MLKLGNDGIWQVLSPSTGDTHSKHRTRGCLQADTAVLCHRLLPLAHNLTFFVSNWALSPSSWFAMTTTSWQSKDIPVLPNELLMQIISFADRRNLPVFLFVCRYTFQLVRTQAYRKAIFPDDLSMTDIIHFCQRYGLALETIKLPQGRYYSDTFFALLSKLCPNLTFLQSSITPKQLVRQLLPTMRASQPCFMLTYVPTHVDFFDMDHFYLPCCSSFFVLPTTSSVDTSTTTHIAHYFHHPGALRNAILPTYGADLLSLTLNPYDTLTAPVARSIISKCPRIRYLVAPTVKAEGLWMLLRWCHTLATIIVGWGDDDDFQADGQGPLAFEDERAIAEEENEKAVETIKQHKRVWCVHPCYQALHESSKSWHIGIIPKK